MCVQRGNLHGTAVKKTSHAIPSVVLPIKNKLVVIHGLCSARLQSTRHRRAGCLPVRMVFPTVNGQSMRTRYKVGTVVELQDTDQVLKRDFQTATQD